MNAVADAVDADGEAAGVGASGNIPPFQCGCGSRCCRSLGVIARPQAGAIRCQKAPLDRHGGFGVLDELQNGFEKRRLFLLGAASGGQMEFAYFNGSWGGVK